MITNSDLINLGYVFKQKLYKDLGSDYYFQDRPYLVNLKDGEVSIIYPVNKIKEKKPFSTRDINEFKEWHKNFVSLIARR